MTAGYSDTPLAKKLGLRDGQRVWFSAMPGSVQEEIGEYALELIFVADPAAGIDAAHVFVSERAELERLGLRPRAGALTEAEARIAELAASGASNREIASRLFISVKTVEANLSRCYRKLGVRSRIQLARRLERDDGASETAHGTNHAVER